MPANITFFDGYAKKKYKNKKISYFFLPLQNPIGQNYLNLEFAFL